jgi:ISXO2 transposase-like protein
VKNVEPEALVYHDDSRPYGVLDGVFNHESVNHSAGEYARGDVHTDTIEGEFSVLRPWLSVFRESRRRGSSYTALSTNSFGGLARWTGR